MAIWLVISPIELSILRLPSRGQARCQLLGGGRHETPEPLGQRFTGTFQPPVQLRSQYGITDINLAVEYLGTNLQIVMEVEKTSLFKFDREVKLIFDLAQFRAAPPSHLVEFLRTKIDELMDRKPAS